jgi:5-oxoprolinase (ATP-hydrolysing)
MSAIYVHRFASVLSAYGLSKAKLEREATEVFVHALDEQAIISIEREFSALKERNARDIVAYDEGYRVSHQLEVMVKYAGSDYLLTLKFVPGVEELKD